MQMTTTIVLTMRSSIYVFYFNYSSPPALQKKRKNDRVIIEHNCKRVLRLQWHSTAMMVTWIGEGEEYDKSGERKKPSKI